jgi:hypothetical protein
VLDDDRERPLPVLGDQAEGGVGIQQVVVGQLLAGELHGGAEPPRPGRPVDRVERGRLVGVLAVAEGLHKPAAELERRREPRAPGPPRRAGDPGRHRGVVGGGSGERLGGQRPPLLQAGAAGGHGRLDQGVVAGVAHHRHPGVVLGGGAHHRRPADVDPLDRKTLVDVPAGDRLLERVEVDHHQVERGDARRLQLGELLGPAAVGQQAGVDPRVEGLHPAGEHLREAGELLHPGDAQAVALQGGGGRAGGDHLGAGGGERGGQPVQALLVEHRHQRAPDGEPVQLGTSAVSHARRPSVRTR